GFPLQHSPAHPSAHPPLAPTAAQQTHPQFAATHESQPPAAQGCFHPPPPPASLTAPAPVSHREPQEFPPQQPVAQVPHSANAPEVESQFPYYLPAQGSVGPPVPGRPLPPHPALPALPPPDFHSAA